ncbi:MAG TPA: hypothetical protein DDX39_12735 [Bacteroidales bacterium]|nr:MAG: hypothetical protein A2W98_05730 [Bacteroidetes bacterium GWF2_33_38]OFY90695.1 MAG: hypothetical protein A2236_01565 [Bacteroidetes bacterium RIFOXYA2_FULL_33_7]HBF89499.1 hypothetical protein [Bacteroidales bacterium]
MIKTEPTYKRTIESVLDLKTGKEVFASDFFKKSIDEIFKLRYEFETAIRENTPRFVCYFCRQAIKIRGQADSKKILHFAHLKDSDDCSIKTNSKYTKEELLRIKYNGAKESDLHLELKMFIANSLAANRDNSKGIEFVDTEMINKHQAIPKIWKKPDVSSKYLGKSVVFELQLSTTFLSVINSRQEFYKENSTFIIWVFSVFETDDDRRKFTQSDVFYNNNRNGFELDEEAKLKSIQENDLVLKCNYQKPVIKNNYIDYKWAFEFVRLHDLTFDSDTFKVYYYDVDGESEKLKVELKLSQSPLIDLILNGEDTKVLELFLNGFKISDLEKRHVLELYSKHVKTKDCIDNYTFEYRVVLATICIKLDDLELIKAFHDDHKLRKTIIDILSLKLGKIIGYAFKKQIQISHRLIDSRPEHFDLYHQAIRLYQPLLIKEQDSSNKLKQKITGIKDSAKAQIINYSLVEKIFPELIKK